MSASKIGLKKPCRNTAQINVNIFSWDVTLYRKLYRLIWYSLPENNIMVFFLFELYICSAEIKKKNKKKK